MFKLKPYKLTLIILHLLYMNITAQVENEVIVINKYDKGKTYKFTTIYGTIYKGRVKEETIEYIVIVEKKTNREVKLNSNEVKEFEEIKNAKAYSVGRFDDDYYTNYVMISENALPFRKQGFSSCYHYFLMQNLNYSFNEHWAVSTNLLVFLPSSIGVKCSYKIAEDIHFGANTYIFGLPIDNSFRSPLFGGAARVTKGNDNTNFTVGGGIMGIRNPDSLNRVSSPFVSLYYLNFSYSTRFAKHAAFAVENFVFPQSISYQQKPLNINLTGVCIKWVRNPNEHWNFGCYGLYVGSLIKLNKDSQIFPIPYVSYSAFFD
jgi:hypothetical protein